MNILLVTFGRSPYSRYAAYQALEMGHRVIVIGDERLPYVEFVQRNSFMTSARRFEFLFRATSTNLYELNCYQRWFIIRDFLTGRNAEYFTIDHDVLVYPQLGKLSDTSPLKKVWTPLVDAPYVEQLADYYTEVYSDPDRVRQFEQDNVRYGKSWVSDLVLWNKLNETNYHLSGTGENLGVDSSLVLCHTFEGYEEHSWDCLYNGRVLQETRGLKKVWWDNDQPHCRRKSDQTLVPMCTLHFQGARKPFMQAYHTIKNPKFLGQLPPRTYALNDDPEFPTSRCRDIWLRGKLDMSGNAINPNWLPPEPLRLRRRIHRNVRA